MRPHTIRKAHGGFFGTFLLAQKACLKFLFVGYAENEGVSSQAFPKQKDFTFPRQEEQNIK